MLLCKQKKYQSWSKLHLTTGWVWTGVSARWSKYESCDTERLCPLDLLLAGPGDKVSGSEFCSVLGCDSRSRAAEFRHEFAPEARDSALFTGRSLRRPWASSFSVTAFSCSIKVLDKSYQVVKVTTIKKDTPFEEYYRKYIQWYKVHYISLVDNDQYFTRAYCLHHPSDNLKREAFLYSLIQQPQISFQNVFNIYIHYLYYISPLQNYRMHYFGSDALLKHIWSPSVKK